MLSFLSTWLQIAGRPQSVLIEKKMCLFNEVMTSIYLYVLLMLTDYTDLEYGQRELIGFTLLGIIIFTFLVNLSKVIAQIVVKIV